MRSAAAAASSATVVPTAEMEPTLTKQEPTPLVERHDDIQKLLDAGLETVQDIAGLTDELKRRCCYCRQWIGDTRHVKQHIKKLHSAEWQQLEKVALSRCHQFANRITAPCSFCGASVQERPRHARHCTVLFQLSMACEHALFFLCP